MISSHKKISGDTIVEVLLSIAIVSVVITGAYSIANRALQQGINASEHTEALKIGEGQIESLKFRQQQSYLFAKDFIDSFANPNNFKNFCLDVDATGPSDVRWKPIANGNNPDSLVEKGSPSGNYDAKCHMPTSNQKYFVNISVQPGYDPASSGCIPYDQANCILPSYWVTVKWEGIGGVTNTSQIYYRF